MSSAPQAREKLHLQLARLFRSKIATGDWAVGQSIPTVQELEAQHSSNTVRPVILTGLELRRHVRRHLESTFGHIPVLSVQELTSTISLNPMGEIRLT